MTITTAIVLEKIQEQLGGEWKRIRKCKPFKDNADAEIRVFQNKENPKRFVSIYSCSDWNDELDFWMEDWSDWHSPEKGKFPRVIQEGCSGEMVYGIGEEDEADEGDICFYCGPQEGDHLNDSSRGWEMDTLKYLFRDMDIEIGAAESYHIITLKDGQTFSEVAGIIEDRLFKAGAIRLDNV